MFSLQQKSEQLSHLPYFDHLMPELKPFLVKDLQIQWWTWILGGHPRNGWEGPREGEQEAACGNFKGPQNKILAFEKCRQVTLKYTCPVSIQRSPHWPAITHLSSGRFGWANAGCESQHAGRDGQTYGSCPKCSSFGDFRGNLLSFVSKRTSYTQAYFT